MVEFRFGVSFVMCFDAVATRLFTPPPYPSPASLGRGNLGVMDKIGVFFET